VGAGSGSRRKDGANDAWLDPRTEPRCSKRGGGGGGGGEGRGGKVLEQVSPPVIIEAKIRHHMGGRGRNTNDAMANSAAI
jgi:hypothetical protein